METTLHFAQNADAGTEESYLRNLPLLKLLAKENIEADDWSVHENQLCDEWQVVVFFGGAAPVRKIP